MTAGAAVSAVLLQPEGTFSFLNRNKWWRWRRIPQQKMFRRNSQLALPRPREFWLRCQVVTRVNRKPGALVTWLGFIVLQKNFSISSTICSSRYTKFHCCLVNIQITLCWFSATACVSDPLLWMTVTVLWNLPFESRIWSFFNPISAKEKSLKKPNVQRQASVCVCFCWSLVPQ